MRCLTIELREAEIVALIRRGLLKAETCNSRHDIMLALYAFLDRTLGRAMEDTVTRNSRHKRMTIEALWNDHLDLRELQRLRMFDQNWVTYSNRFQGRRS